MSDDIPKAREAANAASPRTSNSLALVGYVLGICSILVAGLFGLVGTLAIVFSAIGLSRVARMPHDPSQRTARRRSIMGIVLGSISVGMSVVVIALLSLAGQPRISTARVDQAILDQPIKPGITLTHVECPPDPPIVVGDTFFCTGYVLGGGTLVYTVLIKNKTGEVTWSLR